jgi:hypothetical protein
MRRHIYTTSPPQIDLFKKIMKGNKWTSEGGHASRSSGASVVFPANFFFLK